MISVESMVSLEWELFSRELALEKRREVGFPGGSSGKASTGSAGDTASIPDQEDPLEEGTAVHSSILAWRAPWTEEPTGAQSTEL